MGYRRSIDSRIPSMAEHDGWSGCVLIFPNGRSLGIIDPRIPTIARRNMPVFHRPGKYCLHQAGEVFALSTGEYAFAHAIRPLPDVTRAARREAAELGISLSPSLPRSGSTVFRCTLFAICSWCGVQYLKLEPFMATVTLGTAAYFSQ